MVVDDQGCEQFLSKFKLWIVSRMCFHHHQSCRIEGMIRWLERRKTVKKRETVGTNEEEERSVSQSQLGFIVKNLCDLDCEELDVWDFVEE